MLHRPRGLLQIFLISAGTLLAAMPRAMAADPTGDWRVADGEANIRVAQCNGSMWGVVAWEKDAGGRDVNNPDASKKNRPFLAMPILLDMKKKPGVDQWEGHAYNARDGKLYSTTITPTGADHMEIRGCVLGFLCGGETWTRVGPPIPANPTNAAAKSVPKTTDAAKGTAAATTGSAGQSGPSGHGQPADRVGDICLLPDIARFAH